MSMPWKLLLFVCVVGAAVDRLDWNDPEVTLPESWFWGDVEGINFLTRVQNERAPNYCRASWALSTAAALSDRLKIANPGAHLDRVLSPQVLLNCASKTNCSGGSPVDALEYILHTGIPDDTCQNYEGRVGTCDGLGICRDCTHGNRSETDLLDGHCWAVEEFEVYRLEKYDSLKRDEETEVLNPMAKRMKEEVYKNGPITCAIQPSPDFIGYKEGIVSESNSDANEIHYVNIVGWEESGEVKYWIARNCWGESWGNGGFVKIEMGINAMGIESECYWGTPVKHEPATPQNSLSDDEEEDRGLYRVKKSLLSQESCHCIVQPEDFVPVFSFSQPDVTNIEIPDTYDIRNIDGKNYATIDKNQHIPVYCGSCWVFSATSALADRYALYYKQNAPIFDLSNQVAVNCIKGASGCRGGWPFLVYLYMHWQGLPHESCAPYQAVDQKCTPMNTCKVCEESGSCRALPKKDFRRFGVVKLGSVIGETDIKQEILTGGPIVCAVAITPDFLSYSGGIFNDTSCKHQTEHAIEVAGWGEEDGVKYWIVRNSWGTYWGEAGWARIAIGDCDLGLTRLMCNWAVPKPFEDSLPYESLLRKQPTV